ncbi:hypothetical protein DL96DRAFT_1609963 [Flagelloscypha sp. PMI_526]|nr:hypothetical protein DL96DRAFT_1609963 [Flagelloscypha sp. PMI_526]
MSTQSFPYDLTLAIFSRCDKGTLSVACRAGRVFLNDLSNLLYQRVCLERRDIQLFLNALEQFRRIKHFALLNFYPDGGLNGPWTTLLLAVQERCELVSFKLLGGGTSMPVKEVYPYMTAIIKKETLKYVAIHTFHVDIPFAVQVPTLKELEIQSPFMWPGDLPPTPDALRATLLSLSLSRYVSNSQLRSHFHLHHLRRLSICKFYSIGGTPEDILDLIKETASTLEELSFWFFFHEDTEFLHRSVELPRLRVLVLSDSVEGSCRFEKRHIPMIQGALSVAPRLEEVRLYCQWVQWAAIGRSLLYQLPGLPDFSAQIKCLRFEFSEPDGNSLGSDLLAAKEMIQEKWGKGRELKVSMGSDGSSNLTTFCESFQDAASRDFQE